MKSQKLFFAFFTLLLTATVNAQQINWITDYKEAVAAARESGKPLLLDFTADWCKPCKVMEKTFWVKPEVIGLRDRFIFAKIDFDDSRNVAHKFGVRGIPNIIVTDAWGVVLVSNLGFGGGAEAKIFKKLAFVPVDFSPVREAATLLEGNQNDVTALSKFAEFYELNKFYVQSNIFVERILKLEKDPLKRENLTMKMGVNYLRNGLPDEALDMFEKFVKEFPDSGRLDEVLFAQVVAYERQGKMKNAQKTLAQLKLQFPASKLVTEAEKVIAGHVEPKK
jgi:thioredoxin-like negative regulator of GroEL